MTNYQTILSQLEQSGNLRQLRNTRSEGKYIVHEGRRYLNLSSNDYLGVACDFELQREFLASVDNTAEFLLGSTSSRLLTGNAPSYTELEQKLASLFGREAALVFNSGYHANIGVLPALTSKGDLILADKLVHASIIDGLRLCEAKWERYRHNDLEHLERLIIKNRNDYNRIFIVTESVFSMDGDVADLPALCDLKERYGATLYVDEAHAFGAVGAHGLGLCEATGTTQRIDLIVGTFGKAIASQGAYLVADREVVSYLVNTMRPLIFTTALPPVSLHWSRFVVDALEGMATDRAKLIALGNLLRSELERVGAETRGCSHIVPIVAGENHEAIRLAELMQQNGFWALPIRYPTVPKGEARIRISLHPQITEDEVAEIVKVAEQWKQNG
ncbi:8-amino-7-oxononanoate synthase [uncultured Acetobacteroides sp.]|uniref:aminotransferase class I/II-fold pyridoxal phosphate-dependent enzyme n=1 Tax=uncultured Acetobacteroides sp. TaxID=1760811 RepID=UPI0029F5796C|nr:8-amino-7-oxononanoate synthase [uncultured Acetobacteroides sp.]